MLLKDLPSSCNIVQPDQLKKCQLYDDYKEDISFSRLNLLEFKVHSKSFVFELCNNLDIIIFTI